MSQQRFWHLLAKKISDEASPEEIRELEDIMRLNPDWHYSAQHIQDIWGLTIKENPATTSDAFLRHVEKMKKAGIELGLEDQPKSTSRKKAILIGLFSIAAIAAAFYFFQPFSEPPAPPVDIKSEVSTRPGSRTKLVLPDGSTVWLNAGSKLTYSKNFGTNDRSVSLSGEAFFDVVSNAEVPFEITTPTMHVKVLGTAFNVKSYPSEKTSETTVIRGRVEIISNQRPNEKFVLKKNEKLVVSNALIINDKVIQPKQPFITLGAPTYFKKDSTIIETSWVENRLVFDDEPFSEIAVKMERFYGVKVIFEAKNIEKLRLTGSFINETIEQALHALEMTGGFHYRIDQNTVTITK
jgi:ferric-dicitrate binding protein FerR (iron transport regulator)